jgi:hypothetical protein
VGCEISQFPNKAYFFPCPLLPENLPFSWKLTDNQNGLYFLEEGEGDYIYVIEKLDNETLVLTSPMPDSFLTQPYKFRGWVIMQNV